MPIKDLLSRLAREHRVFQQIYAEVDEGQQRMMEPGLLLQEEILDHYQLRTNVVRQFKVVGDE